MSVNLKEILTFVVDTNIIGNTKKIGVFMDFTDFCQRMRHEVEEFANSSIGQSSAFLIWYLVNYFRIETQDAIDCVCDQINDKGIDGIFVDNEEETIYFFQSKYSPNDLQAQGDNDLRNFMGASQWFENEESINRLMTSTAYRDLKSLVSRLNLHEKTEFSKVPVFVTNKIFNIHAKEYLDVTANMESYDGEDLYNKYTYFADDEIVAPKVDIYLSNKTKIEYALPNGTKAKVYSIKAKELLKLQGIQDRTLFYKNVRYGVGKTRVNKAIKKTISETTEHNNFFLYHNGITIVCSHLEEDLPHSKIEIANYAVINGCQSMLMFYENENSLSNSLFVLVKIIKLNLASHLVEKITYFANNQNSISIRDLRSNDSVQKSLQREFNEIFNNKILYNRKRGEDLTGYEVIIDKDLAAQLITTVYLEKPYDTHLKAKLFGEEYTNIFSRKISADKIYLAFLIYNIVKEQIEFIDLVQLRKYGLSIFFFTHSLANILRNDDIGVQILENPLEYVTDKLEILKNSIIKMWELITPDINIDFEEYSEQNEGFFDYKNLFKNKTFIEKISRNIKSNYLRLIRRNDDDKFSQIYQSYDI